METKKDVLDTMISPDNVEEFSNYLHSNFLTFFRQDLGMAGVSLWYNAFANKCTLREFATAFSQFLSAPKVGKGLSQPLPSDILSRLSTGDKLNQIWKHVMFAVVHYGRNYSPNFEDKRIHAVIDSMGGWAKFCVSFSEDRREQDLQNQFMAAFVAAQPADIPLIGSMGDNSRRVEFLLSNDQLKISVKPMGPRADANTTPRLEKGPK